MKYVDFYGEAPHEAGAFSVFEDGDIAVFFPKRRRDLHKGACGTANIIGGSAGVGASFLAAGACLKSGAGYTKLYLPPTVYPHAIGSVSPACILREFSAVEGELLLADCIAVGMGAGVSEELYADILKLLHSFQGTLVLDADALNALASYGVEALKRKNCRVIVTPHPKEFSRLTKKPIGEILEDPITAALRFAREYEVTVILKNYRSVITDGERIALNVTGSPALAKGGSGDVLSGLLAGTVARGTAPFDAAAVSSFLLGKAGELAALEMGEYAPDATDIIHYLAKAIARYK